MERIGTRIHTEVSYRHNSAQKVWGAGGSNDRPISINTEVSFVLDYHCLLLTSGQIVWSNFACVLHDSETVLCLQRQRVDPQKKLT